MNDLDPSVCLPGPWQPRPYRRFLYAASSFFVKVSKLHTLQRLMYYAVVIQSSCYPSAWTSFIKSLQRNEVLFSKVAHMACSCIVSHRYLFCKNMYSVNEYKLIYLKVHVMIVIQTLTPNTVYHMFSILTRIFSKLTWASKECSLMILVIDSTQAHCLWKLCKYANSILTGQHRYARKSLTAYRSAALTLKFYFFEIWYVLNSMQPQLIQFFYQRL